MSSAEPKHTKIGCGLFAWQPYVSVGRDSRDAAHLWLALYASAPAKLLMPGLWMGGVGSMADAARLSHAETVNAIDVLSDPKHDLIEFDPRHQVLRLTKLPDRCERAPNPNCLRGWWERRKTVPDCGVRDRHLDLVAWLHLPIAAAKRSGKEEMQRAWDDTFGQALNTSPASPLSTTPSVSRSGPGTHGQLDLLATPVNPNGRGNGYPNGSVMVEVKEEEEGEVQERERRPGVTGEDPSAARFRLIEPYQAGAGAAPAGDLWAQVRAKLATQVSAQNFAMWLEPLQGELEGDTLRIVAPTDYHRRWVRDHYVSTLEDDLRELSGRAMRVAI